MQFFCVTNFLYLRFQICPPCKFEENGHIQTASLIRITMTKKKANYLFGSVSHPSNGKNTAKSMTILKLWERPFKWDLAGCPTSICLEMADEWIQVVKNLEIQCYLIFIGYFYCNIEIKRIELKICSWCHNKENSKLFNFLIDIE